MNSSSGTVVDSKVVDLQFQNENFESNAKTSLSTIERLKKALNFSTKDIGAFDTITKGVDNATGSTKGLTSAFGSLNDALGNIKNVAVFSMIADEAIKAKNTVESFVKNVTLDPIAQGWEKYGQKTEAVQTIMAATAKDFTDTAEQMKVVNEQLEKLNWFTDETSYNFVDMTSNIGKFTSNQVPLNQAVTAMEGISNWAAISGQNATQASHAMYNLAQAISVGAVKLIDWKSVENANMATAEFKQTAIETAESLGTLTKVTDDTWKTLDGHEVSVRNFNEALKDEWFTSEVLLQTLDKYGGFTDKLHGYIQEMNGDITASEVLSYIDDFKNGTLDWNDAIQTTGLGAARLKEVLSDLGSEEMEFGRKAFVAAQQAVTFEQAIESVKDAASTAWMTTFETLFGDFQQAKVLWTDLANNLWDVFVGGISDTNEALKEGFAQTQALSREDYENLENLGIVNPGFMTKLREVAKEHGVIMNDMLTDEQWLATAFARGQLSVGLVQEAYENMFKSGVKVDEELLSQAESLKENDESFQSLLDTVAKYADQDVSKIVFGNGEYEEGSAELEAAIDDVAKALGIAQEEGEKVVAVLQALGILQSDISGGYADMTDEELKALGWTDEQIKKFRELDAEGKVLKEDLESIGIDPKSGGEHWLSGLYNIMDSIISLVEVFQESWGEVFPPATANTVFNIAKGFDETTGKIKDFIENSEELKTVFRTVASVVDLVLSNVRTLAGAAGFKVLVMIAGAVLKAASGFLRLGGAVVFASAMFEGISGFLEGLGIDITDVISKITKAIGSFVEWAKSSDILNKSLSFIRNTAKLLGQAIRGFFDSFVKMPVVAKNVERFKTAFTSFKNQFIPYMSKLGDRFQAFTDRVKGLDGITLDNIGKAFKAFKEEIIDYILDFPGFKQFIGTFKALGSDIADALSGIGESIWNYFTDLRTKLDGTFAGTLLGFVLDSITKVGDTVSKYYGKLKESGFSLKGVFDFIAGIVGDFLNFLLGIAKVVGPILLVALPIVGIVKLVKKIASLFISIPKLFSSVTDAISSIADEHEAEALAHKADAFKSIALAIGVIAVALYALSKTDQAKLWSSVGAIAVISALLAGMLFLITKLTSASNKSDKAFEGLKSIGNKINEYIDTMKIDKVASALIKVAASIGILALSLKVISTIDGDKIWSSLGVLGLLSAMLAGMMYVMSVIGKSNAGVGNMLGLFAVIVGVSQLVDSMNKLDVDDSVWEKLGIVELLLASVTAVAMILAEFQVKGTLRGALSVAAIALAVNMLVDAINKLKIDENVWAKLGLVETLLASVTVIAMLLSKFQAKGTVRGALTMLAMALGVQMLVDAINKLRVSKKIWTKLGVIELLLGSLAAIAIILSKFKGGGTIRGALTMLAMSAAIGMLASTINKLKIDKNIWTKVGIIELLLVSLTAISVILSKFSSGGSLGGAASMIALAISIGLIAEVLNKLSKADPEGLNSAIAALSMISLCMMAVSVVMSYVKPSISSMLGIAAFVSVLAIVLTAMSELHSKKVDRIATAISKLMLAISVFVASLALLSIFKVDAKSLIVEMLGLVAIIGAVSLALGLLANLTDADKAYKMAESLSKVFTGLSEALAVAAIVGKFTSLGDITEGVVGFAELLGVFGVLTAAFGYLAEEYPAIEDYINKGAPLLEKVGEVTGNVVSSIINGIGEGMFGDKSPIQMLADDIKYIAETFSSDEFKGNMEKISKVFEEAPLSGLNNLSLLGTGVFFTAGGLLDGIASIVSELETGKTTIQQFVDDIAYIGSTLGSDTFKENLNKIGHIFEGSPLVGINLTALLGTGTLFNLAGFLGSIASLLPELNQGKTAVESFVDDISYIADTFGNSNFSDNIYAIGHVFDGAPFAGINLGGLLATGTLYNIVGLAKSVGDFATKISGEDKTAVESVCDDIKYIAEAFGNTDFAGNMEAISHVFDNAPKAGLNLGWGLTVASLYGITGFVGSIGDIASKLINGQGNVEKVVNDINLIATTMGSESFNTAMENISTIDTKAVEMINSLNKAVGAASDTGLSNSWNDFLQRVIGPDTIKNEETGEEEVLTSIAKFAEDASKMADALNTWKTKTEELGDYKFDTSVISDLASALEEVTNTGGLLGIIRSFIEGEKDYDAFKESAGKLGDAAAAFARGLGEEADIGRMNKAARLLAGISNVVESFASAQLAQFTTEFAQKLTSLADIINEFVAMIAAPDQVGDVGAGAEGIANAISTLSDVKFENIELADEGLVDRLCANIDKIIAAFDKLSGTDFSGADKLKGAFDSVGDADVSGADKKLAMMEEQTQSSLSNVGSNATSGLIEGMSDTSGVTDAAGNLASAALDAVSDTSGFSEKGTAMVTAVVDAMRSAASSSGVADIMSGMVSEALGALSDGSWQASEYGGYLASGFASGIALKSYLAVQAAAAMAKAAAEAIKNNLHISSPSKVTYELGTYFGQGFGNAIEDYSDTAYKQASALSSTALKALGDSLNVIDDVFASEDIYEPLIRPVLDTSEIQNGAGMIGEILSSKAPVRLFGDVGEIKSTLDERKRAASLEDVVSALGLVERSASNIRGGDTYNVNGVTYDDGSNISDAVRVLIHAATVERRR